jgi:hypothetical protein
MSTRLLKRLTDARQLAQLLTQQSAALSGYLNTLAVITQSQEANLSWTTIETDPVKAIEEYFDLLGNLKETTSRLPLWNADGPPATDTVNDIAVEGGEKDL